MANPARLRADRVVDGWWSAAAASGGGVDGAQQLERIEALGPGRLLEVGDHAREVRGRRVAEVGGEARIVERIGAADFAGRLERSR